MSEGTQFDSLFANESEAQVHAEVREPRLYRVILHNDDYTTMDFVVEILVSIFHKSAAEATRVMLDVHRRGQGICGVFVHDIAVTKVSQVQQLSRQRSFPLKCSCEEI